MKNNKNTIMIDIKPICLVIFIGIFMASCSNESTNSTQIQNPEVSQGNELLDDEIDIQPKAQYTSIAESDSKPIERSFENAPPMIPHTVKGFYNITRNQNQCLLCHMPEKTKVSGAKELPQTHMTDYRPAIVQEGDLYKVKVKINETVEESTKGKLNMAMYYCNLCHVPQAEISINIENLFTPEFREASSRKSSNLKESMKEGVHE